ncbi:penicillin acylase family protein [Massilia rubra]|uniref:penicillin acylase family protein n=1 Tax=Massilia rubra TaxID=2607910 RepID=UPI00141F251C|nr:penicillin acylase family protein [Massilia rubra]
MKNAHPLLKRLLILIVLPACLAGAGGVYVLRLSLAQQSGTIQVPGLDAAVSIERDPSGVPHISATSDHDVFFAMGYVHAQDRLWQLELQRRTSQGRLSEVFGRSMISNDVWLRTLGIQESAKASWNSLGNDAKASLTAYANGVNAWIDSHPNLPPEFLLTGTPMQRWDPIDSLAWTKIFALNLAGNLNLEMTRYLAGAALTSQEQQFLFPTTVTASARASATPQATAAQIAELGNMNKAFQQALGIGGRYAGSNAWAISGTLGKDRHALLAGDPHLSLQIPSLWYPVTQRGARLDSAGMSLVGLPLVVFGRNAQIAWTGTNLPADTQDLYFEQVDPSTPSRYRTGETWETFRYRKETIHVKPDFPTALRTPIAPIALTIRHTRHGPVVSDALGLLGQPIALQWTALSADDTTYESFFRLNYAADWRGFNDALRSHVAPTMNMLYADNGGNIGYIGAGRIPMRAKGDGAAPVPGWSDEYNWQRYIPFDELPRRYNPPAGYIVSANDNLLEPGYPYFISNDWAPPGRAQRIAQLIEERRSHAGGLTMDDMQTMQADLVSVSALKVLPLLKQFPPRTPQQAQALAFLNTWKGAMTVDSQAASIFNVWMMHLRKRLFAKKLQGDWNQRGVAHYLDAFVADTSLEQVRAALTDPTQTWCAPQPAVAPASCTSLMSLALDDAILQLTKLGGADMRGWTWGSLHGSVYRHVPFSNVKPLNAYFEKRIESGGSEDTIDVANYVFHAADGYQKTFGAGFRQIMALSPDRGHLYMNSTGQSGNIISQHYADMVQPFQEAQLRAMRPRSQLSILTLSPRAPRQETGQ